VNTFALVANAMAIIVSSNDLITGHIGVDRMRLRPAQMAPFLLIAALSVGLSRALRGELSASTFLIGIMVIGTLLSVSILASQVLTWFRSRKK
jgi:hypothetical protein